MARVVHYSSGFVFELLTTIGERLETKSSGYARTVSFELTMASTSSSMPGPTPMEIDAIRKGGKGKSKGKGQG